MVIHQDITDRLTRIETKLDAVLLGDTDRETRIRSLEKENWLHRGGLAVVAFIATKIGLPLTWGHFG